LLISLLIDLTCLFEAEWAYSMNKTGDLVKSLKSRDNDFSVEAWGMAAVSFLVPIANISDTDWIIIMDEGLRLSKEVPAGGARRGEGSELVDERTLLAECDVEVEDDGEEM
jgi:hypothetical protein